MAFTDAGGVGGRDDGGSEGQMFSGRKPRRRSVYPGLVYLCLQCRKNP